MERDIQIDKEREIKRKSDSWGVWMAPPCMMLGYLERN